jgi:hypothetical protein
VNCSSVVDQALHAGCNFQWLWPTYPGFLVTCGAVFTLAIAACAIVERCVRRAKEGA